MNKYSSIIPRLFQPLPWRGEWAITLGQKTFFSCPIDQVSERWHKHEDCHKRQWARDGALKYLISYLWQAIAKGYLNISYEQEARAASDS